jgi:hypothetical protein
MNYLVIGLVGIGGTGCKSIRALRKLALAEQGLSTQSASHNDYLYAI